MSTKAKVLYVCHKMKPYLPEDFESNLCRVLPQLMQDRGVDIRTFIPRFGCINERRNQLHEVIRLSGMNIVIDDADHQLIIKVASIPSARMQVYFIDNDDYFSGRELFTDDKGVFLEDNDERIIFFARGVVETVSKLRWSPDIVHCHSWFSAITPAYIKSINNDNPLFKGTKVILSLHGEEFENSLNPKIIDKMKDEGINVKETDLLSDPTHQNLIRFTLQYTDGLIVSTEMENSDIVNYAKDNGVKVYVMDQTDTLFADKYEKIYNEILNS